jgi:hypothetical protein
LAASFTVDREIDNKMTSAWCRRFTKTASCHALAVRVRAVDGRVLRGEAAGFMKSRGFYIGDVPGRVSINYDAINYP